MADGDDKISRERAIKDLEDIETLKSTPAFGRYFQRRVLGELKKLSDLVLYDRGQTKDTLWETRLKFLALYDVSVTMFQDEASCREMITPNTDEGA